MKKLANLKGAKTLNRNEQLHVNGGYSSIQGCANSAQCELQGLQCCGGLCVSPGSCEQQ